MKVSAVVLAGGEGKRMRSNTAKQYLLLKGRPVLYYALKAFQDSSVDEIVLVARQGETEERRDEYVRKYGITKIIACTAGGQERFHSVFAGLAAAGRPDYVLIHDGARPLVTTELIERVIRTVVEKGACITGMPSRDTVKSVDDAGYVRQTLDRDKTWLVQTPQAFSYPLICSAYEKILESRAAATDDAMAVEQMTGHPVYMIEGNHKNIKITTPEDLLAAEAFLS